MPKEKRAKYLNEFFARVNSYKNELGGKTPDPESLERGRQELIELHRKIGKLGIVRSGDPEVSPMAGIAYILTAENGESLGRMRLNERLEVANFFKRNAEGLRKRAQRSHKTRKRAR